MGCDKVISFCKEKYGIVLSAAYFLGILISVIILGENLVLPIHDNMDSNIPWMKMFHDNNMWVDRETPVPFLGGVDRAILTCGYGLTGLLYWFFPTFSAFAITYLVHIILSILGFYCMGYLFIKYGGFKFDINVFWLCGIIYSAVPVWLPDAIDFSLLPWWLAIVFFIKVKQSIKYLPLMAPLAICTTLPLLGIFIIFAMVIYLCWSFFVEKNFEFYVLLSLIVVIGVYGWDNYYIIKMVSGSFSDTLKSLTTYRYEDDIITCIFNLYKYIVIYDSGLYHCGITPFCYIGYPLILFGGIKWAVSAEFRTFYKWYGPVLLFILISFFLMAFNNSVYRNTFIPWLSGFEITRIAWILPAIFVFLLAVLFSYYSIKRKKSSVLVLALVFLSIIGGGGLYNVIGANLKVLVCQMTIDSNSFRSWRDYYDEELVSEIKNTINYTDEWSVAFCIPPEVLQYNGIHTLDGYYSNYSLSHYNNWEKLLAPEFEQGSIHYDYWRRSNGQRAYIYSNAWKSHPYERIAVSEYPMHIDMAIFRSMRGKYVFSGVKIINSDELGLQLMGKWDDGIYNIYVYE